MSKLPGSGSNTSLACRALPALAPAPPKIQNEKSSGSGSVVVKSKKSSGKLKHWFTNLHILAMTGQEIAFSSDLKPGIGNFVTTKIKKFI